MVQGHHYRIAIQTLVLVVVCLFLASKYLYHDSRTGVHPSEQAPVIAHDSKVAPHSTSASSSASSLPSPVKPPEIHYADNTAAEQDIKPMSKEEKLAVAAYYIPVIMDPNDTSLERLNCPPANEKRYEKMKARSSPASPAKIKYFFALDLYECAHILPSLMGSIVQTMKFLGPEYCAVSVVEGRSRDSTREVLEMMKPEIEKLGGRFYVSTNDINPKDGEHDRIEALADLRNQALEPLIMDSELFDPAAVVAFVNDVALCMDDILELFYQQDKQGADMSCAMDWLFGGGIFYDVWVARGINGDTFFEVPLDGSWTFSDNLFWNDTVSRKRLDAYVPFQVYACWNGMAVFQAKPIMDMKIKFRRNVEGECYMGEPTLFCKDLWRNGYKKIQVVPSVNVGYNADETRKIKERYGRVRELVNPAPGAPDEMIEWQPDPPHQVKCARTWQHPSWVLPY